ncbi:Hypothetical predicted protein [Mytilus galloprovincialis]|uniref:Uncharacterized protein n=1 Tax=Mytilus galloprovincialis TaxID=29158 RepID=A0A8B6CQE7_MYTGA|nr:Hypothetical predicted protein [Mytilus galloprovincialis]
MIAYISIETLQETPEGPRFELYYGNDIHMKIVVQENQDANGDSRNACTIYLRGPSIDVNAVIQNIDAIKEIIDKGDYAIILESAERGSLKLHITIYDKSFMTKEILHKSIQSFLHEFFRAASIRFKLSHIFTVVLEESDFLVKDNQEKNNFNYIKEKPSPILKLNVSVKDSAFQNEFMLYREVNSFIAGIYNAVDRENVPSNGSAREALMLADNEIDKYSTNTPSSESNQDSIFRMAHVAVVSEEESNYFKLSTLLLRISPRAVRIKFDDVIHPEDLRDRLSLNSSTLNDLKDKRCINQTQWNSMFPKTDDPTSQSFDTTLMICLFKQLAGIQIGKKLPPPTDFSVGADLSRIKTYRKDIANSKDRTFENEKFAAVWNETEAAVIRLSSGKLIKECGTLKSKTYDVAEIKKNRTLIQESKRLVRLEEIKEVADRVEKINFKQKLDETQDCFYKGVEEWEEEKKWFVETNAFNFILNNLDKRSFTVVGNPGMGKSMLMQQIALHLKDSKGYSILLCHNPLDVVNRFRKKTKQVFVLDDVCGRFTLVQSYIDRWKQYEMSMIKLFGNRDSESIILASCRSQIFIEKQCQSLFIFSGCLCDLDAEEFATDNQQNQKIANKYLSQKTISEINQDLDSFDMFPWLCRMYKDRQTGNSISFFKEPFNFYGEELDRFCKEGDGIKCCTLLLCVIHSGCLDPAVLMEEFESEFSQTLETIFENFGLVHKISRQSIIDSFDTLNTYLEKRNGHFCVLNDRLFDFLCYYFGKNYPQLIINFADSEIIRDRTLLKSLRFCPLEFTILIDAKHENEYLERLVKDMLSGFIDDVLYNHQMIHEGFRYKLLSHLQELDDGDVTVTRVLSEYVLDGNERTSQLLPLNFACKYGYKELFEFFLSKTEDVNAYSGNNIPLITACRKEDKLMTRLLLDRDADVNQTDALGCSPLLWSCFYGNLDIIQMLINKKADVNKIELRSNSSPLIWACLGELCQFTESTDCHDKICSSSQAKDFVSFAIENINEQFFSDEQNIDLCLSLLQHGSEGGMSFLKEFIQPNSPQIMSMITMFLNIFKSDEIELEHAASIQCDSINQTHPYIEIMNFFIGVGVDIDKSSTGGFTALSCACAFGFSIKNHSIRYLLSKGASVNKPNIDGIYPLCFAIALEREDLVKLLIKHGAIVNYAVHGSMPLFEAIKKQNISIVECLINAKADINAFQGNESELLHNAINFNNAVNTWYFDKVTPLMLASSMGDETIVDMILKTKVESAKYHTPESLVLACRNNHIAIVRLLLQSGWDINYSEPKYGNTCLLEASIKGYQSMVALLLDKGANVNASNHTGDTSLTVASMHGHASIVQLLIEKEVEMYKMNKNGESSLFLACLSNRLEVIKVLINHGYYIDSIEKEKQQTCLSVASYHAYASIVAFLVENGANVNTKSYIGNTPLMLAAAKGHLDIVHYLIEHKAGVNIQNNKGSTSLSLASSKGFCEIATYLIKHGASVNTQNNIGNTPLILAALKYHLNIIMILIENKADLNIRNDKGSACLSVASGKGLDKIVTYLINQRASIDTANNNGDSPLMLASRNGHVSTVKILLQNGAKDDVSNNTGDTPLIMAAMNNDTAIVQLLIASEAKTFASNKNSESSLILACLHNNLEVIKQC